MSMTPPKEGQGGYKEEEADGTLSGWDEMT